MPSLASLVAKLSKNYPAVSFIQADDFLWSPADTSIHYLPGDGADAQLLHEVSHYILGHSQYSKDLQLISMERQAWEKAKEIAHTYEITITQDTIEDHLDTYREWMHARSTCPNCEATGVQQLKNTYRCPACRSEWTVNEARICGLKRYLK